MGELSILIKHTEILPEHEGKGYGSQLVRRVLDDIRSQTKACSYAMNYVRRHREYLDVVRARNARLAVVRASRTTA